MIGSSIMVFCCLLWGLAWLVVPQQAVSADTALVSSVAEENKDGPDAAILEAIAEKLKGRLTIQHAPFKRRLQLMKDGMIDFMAGLLKSPEREEYIHYVKPPYKERSDTVFFVLKGEKSLIQKYADLYGLKIGTNLGSGYFPEFDNDSKLDKEAVASGVPNFRKLLMGRIDAVIYPEAGGIDLVYKMGVAHQLEMADYRFSQQKSVYIGISKKSFLMDNLAVVESQIGSMIENGVIQRIIVNYYTSHHLPVPAM